jgi:hypothetical protein
MVTTIPKGADDDAHWIDDTVESVREALSWASDDKLGWQENWGPLRSLRVLYENGAELKLQPRDQAKHPGYWFWRLYQEKYRFMVDAGEFHLADGDFPEDKDSEAVERAMIAAAAWFSQVEWARLETDSPPPEPAS